MFIFFKQRFSNRNNDIKLTELEHQSVKIYIIVPIEILIYE